MKVYIDVHKGVYKVYAIPKVRGFLKKSFFFMNTIETNEKHAHFSPFLLLLKLRYLF